MTVIALPRPTHPVLSPAAAAVVGATAPVVAEHAEQISARFYHRMLTERPDLLRLFNKANQATGSRAAPSPPPWSPTRCS